MADMYCITAGVIFVMLQHTLTTVYGNQAGPACQNTYTDTDKCERWAASGHCATSSWMSGSCQYSCGLCNSAASKENKRFEELLMEFFDFRSREFPEFASYVGYHDYDDTLESFRLEAFDRRRNITERILYKVNSVDPRHLTEPNRREWRILRTYLKTFIDGYKWKEYGALNSVNFLEGLAKGPQWSVFHRLKSQSDFEKYIKRLAAVPTQVNEQIDLMRHALAIGHSAHKATVSRVPSMLDTWDRRRYYIGRFESLLLNTKFRMRTKHRLLNKAKDLMPAINAALNNLTSFVEKEYSKATREHPGVHSLPHGVEYYEACLKWYTGEATKAGDVWSLGVKEVDRIEKEIKEIMASLGFYGEIREFMVLISNIPKFYNHTEETLLEGYQLLLKDTITPRLDRFFYNASIEPLKIIPVKSDGPWGSYAAGNFYVNLKEPRKRSTFTMMPLTLHEANPGHHYQEQYSHQWSIPRYRAQPMNGRLYSVPFHFPVYTAYAEGWAMYCEYLGNEMGVYSDPYAKFGRLVSEIFRACRLVVDTGIHAFGWSKQRAIDFLTSYSDFPSSQIVSEVDRYITAPGQACAYKIGEIRIKQMRFDAEKRLGSLFDLKEFHHQVLKVGYVLLNVLEESLNEWIESVLDLHRDLTDHLRASTKVDGSGGGTITGLSSSLVCSSVLLVVYSVYSNVVVRWWR